MTNTKKIRLLTEYIEKGFGERVVLILEDRWSFDPEVYPRTYNVREEYNVVDALNQFKEEKGYVYQGMNFKDIQKAIERNTPKKVLAEFQDTKDKFFQLHPNFFEEQKERFKKFLGEYNKYKQQFM